MKTRLTDFAATAKAWLAAGLAGLTGLSAFIVPDSKPGILIASAVAFLTTLLAVFAKGNAPATKAPASNDYLG